MTAPATKKDAALSGKHDEGVDVEHFHAAVRVSLVVVQRSDRPMLLAVEWRIGAKSTLALSEHDLQQGMLGSVCVLAMVM